MIPTSNYLPVVAVVHDLGSASPLTVRAAATGLCRLVFLHYGDFVPGADQLALLRRAATVVDVSGLTTREIVQRLQAERVAGLTTFSEFQLGAAAELTSACGLPGHTRAVVRVLTDKTAQREALRMAGVDATRHAAVGADVTGAVREVGLPAVIKPRSGAGSVDTSRVSSVPELLAALDAAPRTGGYVIEELLSGDPSASGPGRGDYVSVESVHVGGESRQLCITGKLPLAEPFRETGMFVPHCLSEETASEVFALEAAAIGALGVSDGVTHTEIKLTPSGPRLIEVNGRLGGHVPEIVKRATGIDLVRIALEVALGRTPSIPEPVFNAVTFQVFLPLPEGTIGTFNGADGIDEIAQIPGVVQTELITQPGQHVDWRMGTPSNLGVVYGAVSDLASFDHTVERIREAFRPRFTAGVPA